MSVESDRVKKWRTNTKDRMVKAFGGKCCVCGYNKSNRALAFHHLDPSIKESGIGRIIANPQKWSVAVAELKKCVMLCHNCHSEFHAGEITIPEDAPRFDENFSDLKTQEPLMDDCPICGKKKPQRLITCSLSCAATKRRKHDWTPDDLKAVVSGEESAESAGRRFGVSGAAIVKNIKKLGLHEEFVKNSPHKSRKIKTCVKCGKELYLSTEGDTCRVCLNGYSEPAK